MPQACKHLGSIKVRHTDTKVCEDCVKLGDELGASAALYELRVRGMLRFFQEQACHQAFSRDKHPLIRSIEPGEAWIWCYVDDIMAGELES